MSATPVVGHTAALSASAAVVVVVTVLFLASASSRRMMRGSVRDRLDPRQSSRSSIRSVTGLVERFRLRRRRQRRQGVALELAALLDAMARRSASGHSLATAFVAALPLAGDVGAMRSIADALRSGETFETAASGVATVDPDVRLVIHVLTLCASQGGSVAESLDRSAATLRERHAAQDERRVQAAQARLSAKVLTVVPVSFAGWTMLTTESVQRFMVTPVGLVCLAAGVSLNIAGWSLMQRAIGGAR